MPSQHVVDQAEKCGNAPKRQNKHPRLWGDAHMGVEECNVMNAGC